MTISPKSSHLASTSLAFGIILCEMWLLIAIFLPGPHSYFVYHVGLFGFSALILILGIVGVILGIRSLRKGHPRRNIAIWGLALNVICSLPILLWNLSSLVAGAINVTNGFQGISGSSWSANELHETTGSILNLGGGVCLSATEGPAYGSELNVRISIFTRIYKKDSGQSGYTLHIGEDEWHEEQLHPGQVVNIIWRRNTTYFFDDGDAVEIIILDDQRLEPRDGCGNLTTF